MTSRDFAYWLQGFFELNSPMVINENQTKIIKNHLNLVFKHEIDPSMGDEKHQKELNDIHNHDDKNVFFHPQNESEAIQKFGPKPGDNYVYNIHGWYNPSEGIPRC